MDWIAQTVGNMDAFKAALFIAVAAGAALYAGWRSWHHLNNARTIEDIPTSKARSAAQGYVELEGIGRAMDGAPTIAPISGLTCLWYHYKIEKYVHTGRSSHWRTVEKGTSADSFWLEDETGRAAVDPEGAEVTPAHKRVWHNGFSFSGRNQRTPFITGYLASRHGTYRFTEERLMPGEPVYAIGLLKNLRSLEGNPAIDDEIRRILHEWKQDQATLKQRFDLDGDGKIDQTEWRLARLQAAREARRQQRAGTLAYADSINIMTDTRDRRRPYLLSATPQDALIKHYRRWSALAGAGFFALGAAALWMFNTRFGA